MILGLHGALLSQSAVGSSDLLHFDSLILAQARQAVISIESIVMVDDRPQVQVGTGFIFDPHGFAVTRRSLVSPADHLTVTLHDGRSVRAKIVYESPQSQLALLKLEGEAFYAAQPGSIAAVADQSCLAVIGNSIGVFPSVTLAPYLGQGHNGLIHLGAVFPPGNSGSPVFDNQGRLVAMLVGRARGETPQRREGLMGLALPIEPIAREMESVVAHFDDHPGWVGLSVNDLALGGGVEVINVVKGGPAEDGGLCLGDTIVAVEGNSFKNAQELERLVTVQPPDRVIAFTVKKGVMRIDHAVKVGRRHWFGQK